MTTPAVRVIRDHVTGTWRLTCDLHGDISRYGKFWPASRDCAEHRQVCGLPGNGNGPPDESPRNSPGGPA